MIGPPQHKWWNPASWLNRVPPPFGSWDRSIVPWHTTCEHPPVGVAWLGDSRKERSNEGLEANTLLPARSISAGWRWWKPTNPYKSQLHSRKLPHKATIRISAWNQGSQKLVGLPQAIPGPVIALVDGYCSAISIYGLNTHASAHLNTTARLQINRRSPMTKTGGSRSRKPLLLHFQTSSSWSVLHLHELVAHQNPCLIVKKAFFLK